MLGNQLISKNAAFFNPHSNTTFDSNSRGYDTSIELDPKSSFAVLNKAFLLATCRDEKLRDPMVIESLIAVARQIEPQSGFRQSAEACLLALRGEFSEAITLESEALKDKEFAEHLDITGGRYSTDRMAAWKSGRIWSPE
ncbi:MAG: hypothetical protein U0936_04840 [Planctomycetaceae bacterium]